MNAATAEATDSLIARIFRKLESREHWTDRGPPDFEKDANDLRDLVSDAVREGARRATVEISGGYHEGGGGKDSWQKWMLTVLGGLAVAAVLGGIAMFGKLSSLETKVEGLQSQVDRVQKIVEPRYRGSP